VQAALGVARSRAGLNAEQAVTEQTGPQGRGDTAQRPLPTRSKGWASTTTCHIHNMWQDEAHEDTMKCMKTRRNIGKKRSVCMGDRRQEARATAQT
jgi:hypothetical protein